MKSFTRFAIAGTIAASSFFISNPLLAQESPTRIQFAKGSYCGSYSGNFPKGKQFVLNLLQDQTFTISNIGQGVQHNIFVSGPTGRIEGHYVSEDQINYYIPVKGNYYIYIESTIPYNKVGFCAY